MVSMIALVVYLAYSPLAAAYGWPDPVAQLLDRLIPHSWLGAYVVWAVLTLLGYWRYRIFENVQFLYAAFGLSLLMLAGITIFAHPFTPAKLAVSLCCLVTVTYLFAVLAKRDQLSRYGRVNWSVGSAVFVLLVVVPILAAIIFGVMYAFDSGAKLLLSGAR